MDDEQTAGATTEQLKNYLSERLKNYLSDSIRALSVHVVGGRLSDADQHAVRILESRKRYFDRAIKVHYGTPIEKAFAKIELALKRQDDGSLFLIGEVKHGPGRFDCSACDRVEGAATGELLPGGRLCPNCLGGIQHLYTSRTPVEKSPLSIDTSNGVKIALGSPDDATSGDNLVVQTYLCDNCGAAERYSSHTETEKKQEVGKVRVFMLPTQE